LNRTNPTSAFYVVADSSHFLGLVALINSLRLAGHDEPIYVTDCGLAESHRRRLADHVTLVEAATADTPHFAKTVAPLAHPMDVMVLVDTDIIVTKPLTELIDNARSGKVVAFVDAIAHRFDERWSELLGLGQLRRQPYVNSGLIVAERAIGKTVLAQVAAGCTQVDVDRTIVANGDSDYPFYYLDQDVLNAVLAACTSDQLDLHDHALAPFPPFRGLQVVDEAALRCSYRDGREPFALHHVLRKPWLAPTRWSIYSRLLARLLLGSDVAVPVRRDEVPLRLQPGTIAWLEKRRSDALASLAGVRGRLGLRHELTRRRQRRSPNNL